MNESGRRRSMGRAVTAGILAIIAILCTAAGAIYAAVPAKSEPGILNIGTAAGSTGHHPLRMAGVFVLAAIFLIAAWFALAYQPNRDAPAESRESTPARQ